MKDLSSVEFALTRYNRQATGPLPGQSEDDAMKVGFTEWRAVDQRPEYNGPAVYQLRLSMEGKPLPCRRWQRVCRKGILVIGYSDDMKRRHRETLTAISKGRGSSTANRLRLSLPALRMRYPDSRLEYRFAPVFTEDDAKEMEADLLEVYFARYSELPPLNSSLPQRKQ